MDLDKKCKGSWTDTVIPCAIGGFSAIIGTIIVFPADIVKLRLQLKGETGLRISTMQAFQEILTNEGFRGFFRAMDPALLRQATCGSLRYGVYRIMSENIKEKHKRQPNIFERFYLALVSGFLGGVIGTPFEVVMVRMQEDASLPWWKKRNYTTPFSSLYRMVREEGLLTLWKGSGLTIFIIMLLNLGMLGSYDTVKCKLKEWSGKAEDTKEIRILASGFAGAVVSIIGLPFDNVKMKLQKMQKNYSGEFPYKGVLDCFKKSIKKEGTKGLWTGLPIFALTYGPYAMITLLVQDCLYDMVSLVNREKY